LPVSAGQPAVDRSLAGGPTALPWVSGSALSPRSGRYPLSTSQGVHRFSDASPCFASRMDLMGFMRSPLASLKRCLLSCHSRGVARFALNPSLPAPVVARRDDLPTRLCMNRAEGALNDISMPPVVIAGLPPTARKESQGEPIQQINDDEMISRNYGLY
jgi:hypothetical protein